MSDEIGADADDGKEDGGKGSEGFEPPMEGRRGCRAIEGEDSLSLEERLPLTLPDSLLRRREAGSGLRVHALGAAADKGVERWRKVESNGDAEVTRPDG